MMMKSFLVVGFLVASSAFASKESKPRIASLEVEPNFEYGLTRQEFRVHYSGVGKDFESEDSVSIKIYNDSDNTEVLTYSVSKTEKNTPKAYFFASLGAKAGKYSVEVCAGSTCSEKNPALTELSDKKELICRRGTDNEQGQFVESQSDDDKLSVEIIPIAAGAFIDQAKASQIDSAITEVLKKQKPNAIYQTEFTKVGAKTNPMYSKSRRTFYTGVLYNIRHFAKFFQGQKTKETTTGTTYTPEICERKYILTMNVHLFNEKTKQVEHRFKTALHLSNSVKYGYILSAEDKPIHVEMTKTEVDITEGNYKVWISFCATEKDKVESTVCSDPVVKQDSFVVSAAEE